MDLNEGGFDVMGKLRNKMIGKFFFKISQDTCPWMAFAWIFSRFSLFFKGGLWGKSFIGNIRYFGVPIFPVDWPVPEPLSFFESFLFTEG